MSHKPHLLWLAASPTGAIPPPGGEAAFVVIDDVVYITYGGAVFEAPVTFVGPTAAPSGLITAEDDRLYFSYNGGLWQSPASEVAEGDTAEGSGVVLNDVFYITINGVCYEMPVTATEGIPGMPPGGDTSLVTIDGKDYLRIVFPDGEVRYEEVHEVPTPDGGIGSTPPSDAPYDATAWNGSLEAATKNVLRDKFEALPVPIGFNVKSYGALGNGVADDTPAIQAAVDAAESAGGGLVLLPCGTYRTTGTITLGGFGVIIQGESAGVGAFGPKGSVIDYEGTGEAFVIGDVVNNSQYGHGIANLSIMGTALGKCGVRVGALLADPNNSVGAIQLRNLCIKGFTGSAPTHDTSDGEYASPITGACGLFMHRGVNCLVEKCDFKDNWIGALEASGHRATTYSFYNCYFHNSLNVGLRLSDSVSMGFRDCIFENNAAEGIVISPFPPGASGPASCSWAMFTGCYWEHNCVTSGIFHVEVSGLVQRLTIRDANINSTPGLGVAGPNGAGGVRLAGTGVHAFKLDNIVQANGGATVIATDNDLTGLVIGPPTTTNNTVQGIYALGIGTAFIEYSLGRVNLGRLSITGHVQAIPTNTHDIGEATGNKPRHIYATYLTTAGQSTVGSLRFANLTELNSLANGRLCVTNSNNNFADGISFGAETVSWPRLKISGTTIKVRLGNDSGDANLTVADDIYDATTWDGNLSVPTKNALRDKIESLAVGGSTEFSGYLTTSQPTTSATAVNVTDMAFPVAADEIWAFQFFLVLGVSAAGGNIKFALDVPAGVLSIGAQVRGSSSNAVISADATLTGGVMSTSSGSAIISGILRNGVNAGTLQLTFASGDGSATATVNGNGSYFIARKLN